MRIAVIETALNVQYRTLLRVKNAVDKYQTEYTAYTFGKLLEFNQS